MLPWDWILGILWCLLNHQNWPALQSSVMGKKELNSFGLLLKILSSLCVLPAIALTYFPREFEGNVRHFKSALLCARMMLQQFREEAARWEWAREAARGDGALPALQWCVSCWGARGTHRHPRRKTHPQAWVFTVRFCLHCEWARIKLWFEMHLSCHLKTT